MKIVTIGVHTVPILCAIIAVVLIMMTTMTARSGAMSATLGDAEQQHGKDLQRASAAERQAAEQVAAEQRDRLNRQRAAASEQQQLVDALREEHEQTQKALVTNAVEVLTATLQASSKQLIESLADRLAGVMEQTSAMRACGDEIEEAEAAVSGQRRIIHCNRWGAAA